MKKYLNTEVKNINGIILAAGKGSRLIQYTKKNNKCLIKIEKNNSLIDLHINRLINLKVKRIIIFVNYFADKIIKYVNERYSEYKIEFVYQNDLNGIVGALNIYSKLYIENFILLLADEYYELDETLIEKNINSINNNKISVNLYGIDLKNKVNKDQEISKTFSMRLMRKKVKQITEKPIDNYGHIQGIGLGIYNVKTLKYIKGLKINKRTNQLDLEQLINKLISKEYIVECSILKSTYININNIEELNKLKIIYENSNNK